MFSSVSEAKNKLLEIAKAEEGYLEKMTNAALDSKTGNAGSNNYTKYWKDVYPPFQGQAWCAAFVSWCFMQAFGRDMAVKLLKHWPFTFCPTLAGMTNNKTPKVASIVLFYRNGAYAHTGIVTRITGDKIYTIEGNTSGASGIIPNGGGVCQKSYYKTQLSCMTKYFVPEYKILIGTPNTSTTTTNTSSDKAKTTTTSTTAKTSSTLSDQPKWTGVCTASALNVRKWAGVEYGRITSRPYLTKGEEVGVCDTVYATNGDPWYFVKINNLWYGFVHSSYIQKV